MTMTTNATSKKIKIAIDGYSSTGKSTIAKQLAKKLSYIYVDSGAMYRAVTLFAMENGFISSENFDRETLIQNLHKVHLEFKWNDAKEMAEIYLNNRNIETEIRTLEVSNFVSAVASLLEVREKLVEQQQAIAKNKGVVMDGRDIGTVVFPNADLKFFIIASAEKRAERRFKELKLKGDKVTYEEILKNVTERDHLDSTRTISPLKKADDAIEIDNSNLSLEEQFKKIAAIVVAKLNRN